MRIAIDRATTRVLLLVCLAVATNARGQLLRVIEDPRSEAAAEFGRALASVGDDVAVGAPGALVFGSDGAGRVQVFATNGALQRTFQAPTPVSGAGLGTALVADATRLYAGAPGDQPIGVAGLGAVYVFDVASGALVRIIAAPAPDASTTPIGGTAPEGPFFRSIGDRPVAQGFGRALALGGGRIVVGAPDSIVDDLSGAGAVYVFDGDGVLVRTLEDPSPEAGALFGTSVALIGNLLVVGAPGASDGGVDGAGVVQVFDAATGAFRRTLHASISRDGAEFGTVVGVVDGSLFVSAPGDDTSGSASGAVYVFDVAARLDAVLTPPTSDPEADFGRAALAVGENLLVGADGSGGDQSGEAFLVDPGTSAVVARFSPSIAGAGGRFGFALATTGPVIAIGAPATGNPSAVGRVYLFASSTAALPSDRGTREPAAPVAPGGVSARCPLGATTASIDCRLALLLGAFRDEGLPRVAGSLRRAGRHVRRADAARGPRRMRSLERAARVMGEVTSRLAGGGRAALVAEASAVRADLLRLIEISGPR